MKIKTIPKDFIVEEVLDIPLLKSGEYCIYKLEKRGVETLAFLAEFSKEYFLNFNDIGICGIKDKVALTYQFISIPKKYKLQNRLQGSNYVLSLVGYLNHPLKPGLLRGNNFTIIGRDMDFEDVKELKESVTELEEKGVTNYFDSQRFGSIVEGHYAGKYLLQKNFESALKYFLLSQVKHSKAYSTFKYQIFNKKFNDLSFPLPYFKELKETYSKTKSWKETYRRLPAKLRELIIATYQSYLWNETMKRYILSKNYSYIQAPYVAGTLFFSKELEELDFPLIGKEDITYTFISEIIEGLLNEEKISLQHFKSLSKTGSFLLSTLRKGKVFPKNVSINSFEDNLFKNKYALEIKFFLQKGSYATIVIKELESLLNT